MSWSLLRLQLNACFRIHNIYLYFNLKIPTLLRSGRREEVATISCGRGKSELRSRRCGWSGQFFPLWEWPLGAERKWEKAYLSCDDGVLSMFSWSISQPGSSGNCLGQMNSTDTQKGILGNNLVQNYQKLLKICFFWPLACDLFKFYILKWPKKLNWIKFLIRRLLPKWWRVEFKLKLGRSPP